ncbi:glycoside hydrolase family 16 protein [Moniliophthora roreri MCA 2997]|uniref:Glycoside hydrolase family 16 protein n=2 Tax=Moniliophthora roreri TaxID=221103 RepID=V2XDT3_MONRO|nr:glycoside hydrolase family 16 protein [Moniliophthora roreri MCA 2997]KAI3604996.1 glycoside hydrolase family 16 protein [Moniliophthora roreri]
MFSPRLIALALLASTVSAQTWTLSHDFAGENFFNGFDFNDNATDTTGSYGFIHFIGTSPAKDDLAYIRQGRAIIKVDNTTVGNPLDDRFGRNTILLESKDRISINSLLMFDAFHIPYGCSVWSGLWTLGSDWPREGEIDIIEGVNRVTKNQYALHNEPGLCKQPGNGDQQSGSTTYEDCSADKDNRGCSVLDPSTNSYGSGFASSQGGLYAMLWDETGIKLWFFERSRIPAGTDKNPDPSSWPKPSAFYPATTCDPKTAFGPQKIRLYTNICGAWAGNDGVWKETCGDVAPVCADVVRNPRTYDNAYWDINYLRIFTSTGSPASEPTIQTSTGLRPTSTLGSPTGAAAASNSTGPSTNGNNAGLSGREAGHLSYIMGGMLLSSSVVFVLGI